MSTKWIVCIVVCLVAATACGQKPGVETLAHGGTLAAGDLPPGATIDPSTGQIIDSSGNVIGDTGEGGSSSLQQGSGNDGTTTTDDNDASTTDDHNSANGPQAHTTTGIEGNTIKIGSHAPLTGAAPVPSDSAQKGNDLYYKWLQHINDLVNGRHIESTLKNDNYNPSQAVAVCKELVEKEHVFLLYGFAGTDQIQACARYAASVGVPYLSTGVTEIGLSDLSNYFAVSMTYPEQGPLLADLLVSDLGAKNEQNGMLRFDTPNFEDAHTSFIQAMDDRGAKVVYDRAVSKTAGQAEAQTIVQEMKGAGLDNVYVLTSPVWFLQLLQAAKTQDYAPQWVGVGLTKALDTVASVGCRNGTLNKAKFFSPFPAWADIDRYDPDFKKAVSAVYPDKGGGDDIMLVGWGIGRIIAELLRDAGHNLSREHFIETTEDVRNLKTGVFPTVNFSSSDHFGGSAMHLNEAQCSGYKAGDNRWHTISPFVSNF